MFGPLRYQMFEEWYSVDLETNYANSRNQPNGHFRHAQRAGVTLADGHAGLERAVPGSYDKRLQNLFIGQLRPEILTPLELKSGYVQSVY